jgi:hypothetical protein
MKAPLRHLARRFGIAGLIFFTVKGLIWLAVAGAGVIAIRV